jgi:hypothetical protein
MLHALTSPIESAAGEAASLAGGLSLCLFDDLSPNGKRQRRRLAASRAVEAVAATVPTPPQQTGIRSRERAWPTFRVNAAPGSTGAGEGRPQVIEERCFSLLRANDSASARGSLAANAYRGCSIGCSGCPSASQTVHAKTNAAERLREELRQPRYQVRPLQIGSTADAYQPAEQTLRLTRGLLEMLHDCGHPVILVTRSPGVLRDLDLLIPMAQENRLRLLISLCTLDEGLSAQLEPNGALPSERLTAIRRLSKAGIPVGLQIGPILRGITDEGAEALIEAAARSGARSLQCSFAGEPAGAGGGDAGWADHMAWQRSCDQHLSAVAQRLGLALQPQPLATLHFRPPSRRDAASARLGESRCADPSGQGCLF